MSKSPNQVVYCKCPYDDDSCPIHPYCLIDAAPEMLHALKLASGYFKDAARTSPQHFAGYFKTISEAIAKAEGRES